LNVSVDKLQQILLAESAPNIRRQFLAVFGRPTVARRACNQSRARWFDVYNAPIDTRFLAFVEAAGGVAELFERHKTVPAKPQ
jgi:hypothetical protein